MGTPRIVDSHIHCGVQHSDLPFERIAPLLAQAGIAEACLFAPVEDIYDRDDYHFQDNDAWQRTRRAANRYLLDLAEQSASIYPYLFVWNDFAVDELRHPYRGIKWHRHSCEPEYHYDDPRCAVMLEAITRRRLPVVLEESYANTLRFIEQLAPEAVIVIPHLGGLNGSYRALENAGIWRRANVYADSALASTVDMRHFVERYGAGKLLFGSDFPFGTPAQELRKIQRLDLSADEYAQVVGGNILRLLAAVTDR
ncbi:amidohydrolase family protein [Desulfobulbus sp.]|uniref:amidohydrolase family protein n=1 Tax=Desulfobulbus sp. TaxID=895 RepID=UPI00286F10B5|nr:amidohydrolase family protein [Desulfobulbus sp.]